MNLQEAIQNLTGATARLEALTAERNTAQEALTVAQSRIVELETAAASAPVDQSAEVARLTSELSAATARTGQIEADFNAYKDGETARVNAAAANLIASNGHPAPVATVGGKLEPGAKTVTKAEFEAMSHPERNEFFRKGGKLTH